MCFINLIFSLTEQIVYLPFLNHTDIYIDSGVLESCDDCSSTEIEFPYRLPFGGYFHQSAYVSYYSQILYTACITFMVFLHRYKQMD